MAAGDDDEEQAAQGAEFVDTSKDVVTVSSEKSEEKVEEAGLATIHEVFSFGAGPRKRFCLIVGTVCACISGACLPAMAFYFAQSFEDLGGDPSRNDFMENVRELSYAFMILGVIIFASMSAYNTLFETAAGEMTISLKTEWFNALLRQDLAYFDIKDVSGTATIISTNGSKYKRGVGRKLGEGIQFFITFCGAFGYAFWASWETSLVVLAVVPLMAASVYFVLTTNQSQSKRANAGYAEAGSIVYTAVAAIRTVLSLNAVPSLIEKFTAATEKAFKAAASHVAILGLANGSMLGSFLLSYIPVTLFGAYLLYDQVRENGCDPSGTVEGIYPETNTCDPAAVDVFGALMGITFAASVLPQVGNTITSFTDARAACYLATVAMNRKVGSDDETSTEESDVVAPRRMSAATRRGSTIPLPKYIIDSSSPDGLKPSNVQGTVEFEDVTFAYPTRQETNVFDGFSLKIEAGKTVALVGPSGSGKSTIVQLVERFYDPTGGAVKLDGVDLRELNVHWLRRHVGLVSQEPTLFASSIRENIAYGCPGATFEQIEDAARMANAHDFIKSFPDGYDTQVGDLGGKLSGGQKQRIAIARALVKSPKLLLLDEATSALDSESEQVVQSALDRLLEDGGRTTIVIAHRLSTIQGADMIAVVNGGKVVETGTHAELIAAKGHYFDLVEAQRAPKVEKRDSTSTPSSRNSSVLDFEALDDTPLLELKDVHFCYPSRPDIEVFRGLNLSVRSGETLALVGPSGQGKSTVVQLVERFYDPLSGSVEFEGVDMKTLNVRWLREQIGLVSQEPTLFDTTIAENICFGYGDVPQEEIEEAARQANAHDFIMSFPDGYETSVGAGGTQVSGGQKQRIAIARVLLRKPKILLLDEATSALDSESERVVQEALDKIMASEHQTTIVIAHRLSTIRNADRIAVIVNGKVREIGTHDELMEKPKGQYRRLQAFQNHEAAEDAKEEAKVVKASAKDSVKSEVESKKKAQDAERLEEIDKDKEKSNAKRARLMAKGDERYFFVGGIGAVLAGLVFPAWGFIFAYMIDVLYTPVIPCDEADPPDPFGDCQEYWDFNADEMKDLAAKVAWGCLGAVAAALFGNMLLFYGFGTASEKMNKRVRDAAFVSLLRQEVGYFDLRPVGTITSQLQEDAALVHSFSGEPIRTLVLNLASVLVGLIVSFIYMWPFALLTLAILPFMAFGAEAEMKMYMGEDEGDDTDEDEHSPGGIVIETLLNIRTVASLGIEETRSAEYVHALRAENPTPYKTNFIKGCTGGLGQFIQFWGIALMFWWGGWLLHNYSDHFSYNDFLISMFALLFSLYGLAIAAEGATDREKAKLAADRIFELTDRESAIDPLSEEGKKDV